MIITRSAETKLGCDALSNTKVSLLLLLRPNHVVFTAILEVRKNVKNHIKYLMKVDGTKTSSHAEADSYS